MLLATSLSCVLVSALNPVAFDIPPTLCILLKCNSCIKQTGSTWLNICKDYRARTWKLLCWATKPRELNRWDQATVCGSNAMDAHKPNNSASTSCSLCVFRAGPPFPACRVTLSKPFYLPATHFSPVKWEGFLHSWGSLPNICKVLWEPLIKGVHLDVLLSSTWIISNIRLLLWHLMLIHWQPFLKGSSVMAVD